VTNEHSEMAPPMSRKRSETWGTPENLVKRLRVRFWDQVVDSMDEIVWAIMSLLPYAI